MANNNPLGYPTDTGVEDFKVPIDYRVLNRIQIAGPSPNAVYGVGSWIRILDSNVYNDDPVSPLSKDSYAIDVGVGTRGVNQDLPGLTSGGVDLLPLQVRVTNPLRLTDIVTDGLKLKFTDFWVDFYVQSPSAARPNVKTNVVTDLSTTGYGTTENILTDPESQYPESVSEALAAFYPFPTDLGQEQPSIAPSPIVYNNIPDLTGLPSPPTIVWRLTVPPQRQEKLPSAATTIIVNPIKFKKDSGDVTLTTGIPYIINVNAVGHYGL